ncbi:MAG: copper homeostasis membrane protein CopD [Croceibacterium sp.]
MLEPAVIAVRLLQYLGAMVLFGSSLFFVYARSLAGPPRGARALVAVAGAILAIAALLSIAAQASLFAGSFAEGLTAPSIGAVIAWMPLGKAALVRALAAAAGVAAVALSPRARPAWPLVAAFGAVAAASLAWMGHGGATEGPLGWAQLIADMLHALAAAAWLGALAAFALLLAARDRSPPAVDALYRALHGFSGIGTGLVAVLGATGLVNGWVLVGPAHLGGMIGTPYGRLLSLKLVLFAAMLALAARNRFRLTPVLAIARAGDPSAALGGLRRSVLLEAGLGLAVLALVAWLGTLAPPAAA